MSKFLGPIHYKMYDKIKFQDIITKNILNEEELNKLNEKIQPVSTEPLENIIDQENIHGFLSAMIDIVESRLSYTINNGENIYEKAYNFAKQIAPDKLDGAQEIFESINNIILDGMPCDHALDATLDENNNLNLITVVDTHEKYADNPLLVDPDKSRDNTCEGGHDHDDHERFHLKEKVAVVSDDSESDYYKLREALLKGYLEPSGHEVIRNYKNFTIK